MTSSSPLPDRQDTAATTGITAGIIAGTTTSITAITLDLDDTLWPVWPAIERAEALLMDWLAQHAPTTAAAHDRTSLRLLRDQVALERPDWAHDLSAIRRTSIARALAAHGEDPALAEPAFEAFFAERQRVDLYDDVHDALGRLSARYPIVALTNGNADVHRVGLGRYFHDALTARDFGRGKPHPAIFMEACRRAGAAPANVLHVGDDVLLDVDAALDAGLQAAWVRRATLIHKRSPSRAPHHVVENLAELVQRLGL